MPEASGSFRGRSNSQAILTVNDVAGHELSLVAISGPQSSADPLWNGATVSYWGIADLTDGNGTQRGYFTNAHADGDTDRDIFECRVTTAGGVTTMDGTWQFTGGTGAFARLTGRGTYKGRVISPSEVDTSWQGSYQLG